MKSLRDILLKIAAYSAIVLFLCDIISLLMRWINIWQGTFVAFIVIILYAIVLAVPDPSQKGYDL